MQHSKIVNLILVVKLIKPTHKFGKIHSGLSD